jgi:hypothetical protein
MNIVASYRQYKERGLTGLVASCLGTDLKQVFKGKIEVRIEVTGIR